MAEVKTGTEMAPIPNNPDWIAITHAKATTYANDLANNPARLKDPNHCNLLYGAFQGSEGDYVFHQKNAIEQLAINTQVIEVSRAQPASANEHAVWFLDSVLNGNSAETRIAVLAKKHFNYDPGEMYRAIQHIATERGLNPISVNSICKTYNDLSQTVDHNLPYLPNGERTKIDIVFTSTEDVSVAKQEKETKTIHIGDPLPEHYQNPLEQLSQVAPGGFKEQATRLAYYFYALDNNLELMDKNGRSLREEVNSLAQEIADLPAIHLVYILNSSGNRLKGMPPEECLPQWVTKIHLENTGEPENGIPQASEFYNKYAPTHGEKEDDQQGTYYLYDQGISPPRGESSVDTFKCYLEHDTSQSQLEATFKALAELKIHPHSSKLSEGDRIVLYWKTYLTDELSEQLAETFNINGVPYRGFGQDSSQVKIQENGSWEFNIRSSNDLSRGETGGAANFSNDKYTPQRFFELYLQQMMRHCRNPLNPYRMSFVPVIGESDTLKDQEQLKLQLAEIEKRGLDVAWYKKDVPTIFK